MTRPPALSLRDAVLDLVRAVPEVVAVCEGRIAATVPTTGPLAILPHVTVGPIVRGRGENGGDPLGMMRLRLFIASSEPRSDQAWTLAHAIEDALEGAEPAIGGGFHLIDVLRVTQSGDVLDKISPSEVFVDLATVVQAD
jgi:hypothetical protein